MLVLLLNLVLFDKTDVGLCSRATSLALAHETSQVMSRNMKRQKVSMTHSPNLSLKPPLSRPPHTPPSVIELNETHSVQALG